MDDDGADDPTRNFSIGVVETAAFLAVLYLLSRVTGISFGSAAFVILFLLTGALILAVTLVILRRRR